MRKLLTCWIGLFSSCLCALSQGVGVNETGAPPHQAAILDASSTTKGFLPPRMTTQQRDAITNPPDGLVIFNLTTGNLNFFFAGSWFEAMGSIAYPVGTVHCGSIPTAVVDVINPTTGRTWMDRNLGASRAATSSTDAEAYGDLYQWGRRADGHQCRNSATTTTLSSTDQPSHGSFILVATSPNDWRSPQNGNLWQGVSGVNNPCPNGYRVPTQAEFDAERASWSSQNSAGAFASPLKLPLTGLRNPNNGLVQQVGTNGYNFTSTVSGSNSILIGFTGSVVNIYPDWRVYGMSVRCIKEAPISSLNCGGATSTGTLTQGIAATGVSSSVPYTGGNGSTHNGQTVTSTGVTGLTATLAAGSFASGTGSLIYTITGTPNGFGIASFALVIGGQACTLTRTVNRPVGTIATINCAGATHTGTLTQAIAATGVSSSVPYTGGNAGTHNGQTVTSTGVTGLTATLAAGNFDNGTGTLIYTITGTPASSGTANFALNIGGQTCTLSRTVNAPVGTIATINCANATHTGTLSQFAVAINVNSSIPYTGGNGGTHNGQSVNSTGVIGLTATLTAGNFAVGAGTLVYSITGTPTSSGTASFEVTIGGQTCTFIRTVTVPNPINCAAPTAVVDVVNPTTGRTWMDRNLGASRAATSSADAEAYGDLYQWGRRSDGHQCRNSATTTTLSSTDQPAHGSFILGPNSPNDWRSPQNSNLWQGVNGVNNPCPSGYQVPTEAELNAERLSWSQNNSAGAFASPLKLPSAGWRHLSDGSLYFMGYGLLWSSTASGTFSGCLDFGTSTSTTKNEQRAYGMSVRCLKEVPVLGVIQTLLCSTATNTGTLTSGTAASGVSSSVPYTGGNGGTHNGQTVTSTGVTGLTATLGAGTFATGAGSLTYTITGTPSAAGIASFALNIGGQTCILTRTVGLPVGTITALNCSTATNLGTLIQGVAASGASSSVPYTGGNGGTHSGQTVTSTGVTGLTATLAAGTFATGAGSLTYTITGTPSAAGTASFALNIGGRTCTLTCTVNAASGVYPAGTVHCTPTPTAVVDVVNPATGRTWMDRNLGASRVATSSTDADAYGDLYQWGRRADGHQCRNSLTTSTLSSTDQPAHGSFILTSPTPPFDWRSPQNTNLWQGINGVNNPCPTGYRLPTMSELNTELLSWNTSNGVGAFSSPLKFSLVGSRLHYNAQIFESGIYASYWSSTVSGLLSNRLLFSLGSATVDSHNRGYGFAIRCLKELPIIQGTIQTLACSTVTNTGTLTVGTTASGVSSSVPYTGGNGGTHSGQTVTSTGVTGLTATLAAGSFANGAGSLIYNITGTPASSGTASFALNIGGQTCTLTRTVNAASGGGVYPAGTVHCTPTPTAVVDVVNPTTGRTWMDRNLGASRVATSSTDADAYGDLYQWGRRADGHQCRNSATTNTLSSTDQPAHGSFIVSAIDWRNPLNNNLWQGLNGINNPCPSGYRIPTDTELAAERLSWSSNNVAGAFASPLKLTLAGYRDYPDGSIKNNDVYYWSSTISGSSKVLSLAINSGAASIFIDERAYGQTIRCTKN